MTGGADLVVRYSTGETAQKEYAEYTNLSKFVIRAGRTKNDDGSYTYNSKDLFWVEKGLLSLRGIEGRRLEVCGFNEGHPLNKPLINAREEATNLVAVHVNFRYASDGAIRIRSKNMSSITLRNCTFDETVKRTSDNGGAVYVMETTADQTGSNDPAWTKIIIMNLENCYFNNTAATGGNGGAVAIYGRVQKFCVKNSRFNGCSAQSGGALALYGPIGCMEITDGTTFQNCIATAGNGGAIHTLSRKTSERKTAAFTRQNVLSIKYAIFKGCEATKVQANNNGKGGAIAIEGQTTKLNVIGTQFNYCYSVGRGGAMYFHSQVKAEDAIWTAQPKYVDPKGETKYYGGEKARSTVHCFIDGIMRTTIGKVTISNGTSFFDCATTAASGGAICVDNDTRIDSFIISGRETKIDRCKADVAGSAIMLNDCIVGEMQLTNITVQNCSLDQDGTDPGGTIRTIGNTTCVLVMKGCTIQGNTSQNGSIQNDLPPNANGGGLYWNANNNGRANITCKAEIINCKFLNNKAERDGGAIYCEASIIIKGCTIAGNSAKRGGGIAQQVYNNANRKIQAGEATELTLDSKTEVYGNTASNHGGGISIIVNATLSIPDDTELKEYLVSFTLGGAKVYNNTAKNNGGGVYFLADIDGKTDEEIDEIKRYEKKSRSIRVKSIPILLQPVMAAVSTWRVCRIPN